MSSTSPSDLAAEISALGDRIRALKASKEPFAEEVVKLKELKTRLPPPPPKTAEQIKEESDKTVKQKKGDNKGKGAHGKLVLKVPKVSSLSSFLLFFSFFRSSRAHD